MNTSILNINDFEVWVSLGCSKEEQSFLQPVLFSIIFEFKEAVHAEHSDQLNDAIDYVVVTDLIKKAAEAKPYHLIESMCFDVTETVSAYIVKENFVGQLIVKLVKLRPPVAHLNSGVSWTCQRHLS